MGGGWRLRAGRARRGPRALAEAKHGLLTRRRATSAGARAGLQTLRVAPQAVAENTA